ncbi:MAG TPA: homoserine dehydrogenase [Pyrinomonadaceae bacterium]|nr:homoserine dehydrogenase [Pyrinomonadaceae bacterium]
MSKKTVVLKFGSSVLRDEADLPCVVHEIYRHWRNGSQVLAVVSALGKTTDQLLERAEILSNHPHPRSVAGLLSTGEATSAALLGIALDRAGIPVDVLSPADAGLRTAGDTLNAEPVGVDVEKLRESLQRSVVVLSGFVGVDSDGGPTLLGRGGSDLTALYLAHQLDADAILVKDVDALYESNPNVLNSRPRRFSRANWETAIRCGDGVVQEKAVRFAVRNDLSFSIAAPGHEIGTEIYAGPDEYSSTINARPLRVGVLGCGTVGGGVFQALASLPQYFEIVGIADRNRNKAEAAGVPCYLYSPNPIEVIERDCDVIVELFGRTDPTASYVEHALNLGRHVVTANKALLAERIDRLESVAGCNEVELRYSAAVGGVMPALERVTQNEIVGFAGIVNGTCNFICDELGKGVDFADAVRAAQAAGFAEADPTLDINGTDAAQKLILLVRSAFGETIGLDEIDVNGVDKLDNDQAQRDAQVIRLIARCRKTATGIEASVRPVELPKSHPFAATRGAENALVLETIDGDQISISGRGAGRWPTSEAVVADLLELYRTQRREPESARFAVAAATTQEVYA